jgi:hypothetical protein
MAALPERIVAIGQNLCGAVTTPIARHPRHGAHGTDRDEVKTRSEPLQRASSRQAHRASHWSMWLGGLSFLSDTSSVGNPIQQVHRTLVVSG